MRQSLKDMRIRNLQHQYPTARVVGYANGDQQVVIDGKDLPHLGEVVRYSNGDVQTVVNIY